MVEKRMKDKGNKIKKKEKNEDDCVLCAFWKLQRMKQNKIINWYNQLAYFINMSSHIFL